ncbi:MAG: hypothetical protein AW07_01464 [Candidatus Accumulibacter sp. SK-11]|nr:MAG: hypothetical protein AW07_01464 [Candidatus Accumulibacter sp. SK-11]
MSARTRRRSPKRFPLAADRVADTGGVTDSVQLARISSSSGKSFARPDRPCARSLDNRPGRAAATRTPSSPKPSRLAVRRVRSAALLPSSAPHAW